VKTFIRNILRVPEKVDTRFHLQCLLFRYLLRINTKAPWPVHFTSRVVAPEKIRLGRATYPGDMPGCYIQAINGIEVGDYSIFAPGVGLISANHDWQDLDRHLPAEPIRIGKHCWVGMNAVILPGVQLGDYTVVGAGSVVTSSFPQGYCMIAGNPARLVRELPRQ
jgi:acetyltransferase-like isoleucine patch superfamily enzyme